MNQQITEAFSQEVEETAAELPPETPPAADLTDFLPADSVGAVPAFPHPIWHPLKATAWIVRTLFGIVSLILLLAVVAAIPVVNFLALGYLLETEGRVARTGRLRFAFPLLDLAPRIGSIVLGVGIWVFPLRLLAGAAADARLIDPAGAAARGWSAATYIVATLVAVHLCLALARGGSLGCFFRPLKNLRWVWRRLRDRSYWEHAERSVGDFLAGLRLKHHFWLGLRGFVGALAWLLIPTALFAAAEKTEGGPILVTIFGGLCLVPVLAWVPFLQARFAAENRTRALFELKPIRWLFCNAPLAWLTAIVVTYVLSIPLFLLKVRLPPQDAMWLVTIVFIVSIYPSRVLTGWAYHRAVKRGRPAWFGLRWLSRAVMIPLLGFYVFLFFFTQFIAESGKASLFLNHALLLPAPF